MLYRTLAAMFLLVLGYTAGTLAPHATAADSADGIVRELRSIRGELTQIRRVMERAR